MKKHMGSLLLTGNTLIGKQSRMLQIMSKIKVVSLLYPFIVDDNILVSIEAIIKQRGFQPHCYDFVLHR